MSRRAAAAVALPGAFALALAPDRAAGGDPASREDSGPDARTRVVLLGTGTPRAHPERAGPGVAVVVDGVPYLVDFGAGVMRRASQARRSRGIRGLGPDGLRRAFVTHLHSDHTAGYANLILKPWVLGRPQGLDVYGPPGLRAMTRHLLAAYRADIHIRTQGWHGTGSRAPNVETHEVEPGVVYRDPRVTVEAFTVLHGSWAYAYGYRFETPDRTVVVSGDTRPSPTIVEQCDGCDVLVHEVYSKERARRRRPPWQRYHAAFHTSGPQLGRLAAEADPKLLVLYHQLSWGASPEALVDEVHRHYDGRVVFAHDLDVF